MGVFDVVGDRGVALSEVHEELDPLFRKTFQLQRNTPPWNAKQAEAWDSMTGQTWIHVIPNDWETPSR